MSPDSEGKDLFCESVQFIECRVDSKEISQIRPVRQELISSDALYSLARSLGKRYKVSFKKGRGYNLKREFQKNAKQLEKAFYLLGQSEDENTPLPTGSEWIIDNYPLLEQHVTEVGRFFKGHLILKLPKIEEGPYAGYPRIYLYALELLLNTDSSINQEILNEFMRSSQYLEPLTIRELWSFPNMLRIVLFANLSSLAQFNIVTKQQSDLASRVVETIFSSPHKSGSDTILLLAGQLEKNPQLWKAGCTVQLLQKLKERGSAGALCVQWLNQKISEMGGDSQTIVQDVLYLITSNQISISHCFGLFRKITIQNWDDWFEHASQVHGILKQDPGQLYEKSNFVTRDRCRNQIEFLSHVTDIIETEIGNKLISFCKEKDKNSIYGSVCYYLIDKGKGDFEKYLNAKIPLRRKCRRWVAKNAFRVWLASFFCVSISLISVPVTYLYIQGTGWLLLGFMSFLFSILASEISFQFLQWLTFHLKTPCLLPKLGKDKVPQEDLLTLVAVQTIFTSREKIKQLVEELEITCLSNNEPNIYYALVADFADSKEKVLSEDKDLVSYAKQMIDRLNAHMPKFFLIMRDRRFSPTEQLFIGWERKRGKIHQLNQLILGKHQEDVHLICGELAKLHTFKYVITLDEDTKILPGNAQRLINTIAHPLNKAEPDGKRGYVIIQPSLDAPFGKSLLSRFSNIFSEAPGTDPYTRLISNINQDLFNIGNYVGKGIYNVADFEKALDGWIPEGRILSHDLLEGSFANAGFASDISFLDSFPTNYYTFIKRLHRWTRGDWQTLSWIFSRVPNAKLEKVKTPLSLVRRWWLLDNLRRSLVGIATFLVLIGGMSFLPGNPYLWIGFIFFSINLPFITTLLDGVFIPISKPEHIIPTYFRLSHQIKKQFIQSFLRLAFIPSLCYMQTHAIVTTVYRLFISKKHFLEWTPTAFIEASNQHTLIKEYREFATPLLMTAAVIAPLVFIFPIKVLEASPLILLWAISPYLSYIIGLPPKQKKIILNKAEKRKLFHLAWDTWKFFDELITEKTHYLVPDNIQMVPLPVIAPRTSPTNIGFQFLSIFSAYDLGFIYAPDMIHRFKQTFDTIEKLEKYKGHLYNWYNIETLQPLYPKYVSSVDSGNLSAYYITLRSGLKDLSYDLIFTENHWNHLVELLEDAGYKFIKQMPTKMDTLLHRIDEIQKIASELPEHPLREKVQAEITRHMISGHLKIILDLYMQLADLRKLLIGQDEAVINNIASLLRAPIPTWKEAGSYCAKIFELIQLFENENNPKIIESIRLLKKYNKEFQDTCHHLSSNIHFLIERSTKYIQETDFQFLYSPRERLLSIGYQVESNTIDSNYYTFLASESCLTSLVAIAKGDVESKHWFALGRQLVKTSAGKSLLSWSGSTFEYLMPFITINPLPNTLLKETYKVIVQAQKNYGKSHHLPWGISESGYGITDADGNYQYRGFGIPELGLKRGLHEDLVISPYSTILSLPLDPKGALENIEYLEKEGARGNYGFYESIDYTPRRLTKNEKSYILESHLGHHQGMILTTLNNVLNDGIFQKRFQECAHIEAFITLLEEQFPYYGPTLKLLKSKPYEYARAMREKRVPKERYLLSPHTKFPDTHLLSNGKLSEMIDNAGSGYLFYKRNIALTRWKENAQSNDKGYYIFIRDLDSKETWSVGYQPTRIDSKKYEVIYGSDKVTIQRSDFDIDVTCEITISPDNNAEIRKLTLTNHSKRKRKIEISSYGEVTLTSLFSDNNHPTFSNMFIESEYNKQYDALIFRRIPRTHHDQELFLGHMLIYSVCWSRLHWDTSRMHFIGRNRDIHDPISMTPGVIPIETSSRPLDPIFSLRPIIEIDAHATETISFVTAVADTKDELIQTIKSYFSPTAVLRAFEMSLARSNVEVRYEQIPFDKIHLFQEFSRNIFFHLASPTDNIESRKLNRLQQSSLWRFGISGDYPIVLIKLTEQKQLPMVKDLMTCHRYLDRRGLNYDLVILNEVIEGYRAEFQDELLTLLSLTSAGKTAEENQRGGKVHILKNQEMSREEVNLIEALAQEIYTEKDNKIIKGPNPVVPLLPKAIMDANRFIKAGPEQFNKLMFYNGYGGFFNNGKGYRIFTEIDKTCPHPWSNVVGSKAFGFLVTETGGGYTWSENSQENRLTPWNPDTVSDPKGEMLFIRDTNTKEYCSLMTPPAVVDYHFGYTSFTKETPDLMTEVIISGSMEKKVKWWKLKIKNKKSNYRHIELFLYVDFLLGVLPSKNSSQLITEFDNKFQIIQARNHYNGNFSGRTVFIGASEIVHSFTTSKQEFIGRNQDLNAPAALHVNTKLASLKNLISSGTDTAGVIHLVLQVHPDQEKELLFFIGEENTQQEAKEASIAYKNMAVWKEEWKKVSEFWSHITNRIEVKTDDLSFNYLMNGWLIYQTLSCRILAKTGYYQCSGAIGFRDQLQDSMAMLMIDSTRARNQLLLHASRQFIEGDVQHWWSPPGGKGVRTRFSDDYLWMPYCLLRYLQVTGDYKILDEVVPYLEGQLLKDDEQEIYFQPSVSATKASLYDHCILALDRALKFGTHGLPFIGCGDWNDGMNEIGVKGKGESVWLGWFLYDILNRFRPLCEMKNDPERSQKYLEASQTLAKNIDDSSWDGDWYRRAYFDDGTPLGSKVNDACEIDSLSQSWSVISGAGKKERQIQSIESAIKRLVKKDSKVICLLTPPFTNTKLEPGYIKSYPPGVRENGAQYTHAATWLILASTMLGKGNQAYDLFKIINPIIHTLEKEGVERYKGEPFVLAGDVYSESPYSGQVGWSWYTGASGWLFNVALEGILGLKIRSDHLMIEPCVPSSWKNFEIKYRKDNTLYDIHISNPDGKQTGVKEIKIDGIIAPDKKIPLESADRRILVEVLM